MNELLKEFEGLELEAYLDTGGVWTIGYGTTVINGRPVQEGDTCTKEEAEQYFEHDLQWVLETLDTCVLSDVPLNDKMHEALVSFIYNIGSTAFRRSTLLRKLNNKDYLGAANEFLRWNKDNGKIIPGLTNRRKRERLLFLKGVDELNVA